MKYFFDTEFIEHATGIQLLSIGIIREDRKRSIYCESCTFDERLADQWVSENVISKLKFFNRPPVTLTVNSRGSYVEHTQHIEMFSTELGIKNALINFLRDDPSPEFYAYYASYDWVVFARIFGRMIDLPKHFPMWVIDLKQMMWDRGLTNEWKQGVCPDPEGEHNALVDAKWNLKLYEEIMKHKLQ